VKREQKEELRQKRVINVIRLWDEIVKTANTHHWTLLREIPESDSECGFAMWLTPAGILLEASIDTMDGRLYVDNSSSSGEWSGIPLDHKHE
jgi:hypothetical protein